MAVQNRILTVIGRKGCGKTTLVKAMLFDKTRLVIIDSIAEYDGLGLPVLIPDLERALDKPQFRVRVFPQCQEDVDYIAGVCYATGEASGAIWVCQDEAGKWQNPSDITPNVKALLNYGRHAHVNQIYAVRRPVELHRDTTAQTDAFYIFNTVEPRDVDYLAGVIGRANAESLKNLAHYEYVRFEGQTLSKVMRTKPMRALGRTQLSQYLRRTYTEANPDLD